MIEEESLHPTLKVFFKEISENIIPSMPAASTAITEKKFKYCYSTACETTSLSTSNLHLGHWIGAARSLKISKILTTIIRIVVTHSCTLDRWKRITGVLLEKPTGNPYIHKFRTIHIIELDLNWVVILLWGKELIGWKNTHNTINYNQYGGR